MPIKIVLAIDPGTEKSGWVLWDGAAVLEHGIAPNDSLLAFIPFKDCDCVIEQMSCYGARVGRETFETIHFAGRFYEAWRVATGVEPTRIERRAVKQHLCGTQAANDAAIWAVLRDRFGEPGTVKQKGVLHGVTSHQRAALALAVTYWDLKRKERSHVIGN